MNKNDSELKKTNMKTEKEINAMIGDYVAYGGRFCVSENAEDILITLSPADGKDFPEKRSVTLHKDKGKFYNSVNDDFVSRKFVRYVKNTANLAGWSICLQ